MCGVCGLVWCGVVCVCVCNNITIINTMAAASPPQSTTSLATLPWVVGAVVGVDDEAGVMSDETLGHLDRVHPALLQVA